MLKRMRESISAFMPATRRSSSGSEHEEASSDVASGATLATASADGETIADDVSDTDDSIDISTSKRDHLLRRMRESISAFVPDARRSSSGSEHQEANSDVASEATLATASADGENIADEPSITETKTKNEGRIHTPRRLMIHGDVTPEVVGSTSGDANTQNCSFDGPSNLHSSVEDLLFRNRAVDGNAERHIRGNPKSQASRSAIRIHRVRRTQRSSFEGKQLQQDQSKLVVRPTISLLVPLYQNYLARCFLV